MRPPKRENGNFEKVKIGEMLPGVIEEVKYDLQHKFKGFQGKADTVQSAVRISFKLDGYKFPHYSRWMKFNVGEKSNLYKKYLSKLVENARPDMDFDLDLLEGMKVKTLWAEQGDFQNLESIFPNGSKIQWTPDATDEEHPETIEGEDAYWPTNGANEPSVE